MSAATKGIFIVAAKRTPYGTYGGTLKNTSTTVMQTVSNKAALAQAGLSPEHVDTVIIGNVVAFSSSDGGFLARHSALHSGIPKNVPALLVNRLCGSGFQSLISGAQDILTGVASVSLTGGAENMSQSPYCVRNIRFGTSLGQNIALEDSLVVGGVDTYCNFSMGVTAENIAEQYKITREEIDAFSLRSQQRWAAAHKAGVFETELAPITLTIKKKEVQFTTDEHPRPNTTAEGLAKLPAAFKKGGVVTAGSSSGICDGAGTVILASEEAVKRLNLKPLARLVGFSYVGCEPSIMGIGPVPAITNVLKATGTDLKDIDLIEINEAFAAQTLGCVKALGIDESKLNVNGGAVAVGHPLGASGSRIIAHLVHELRRQGLKRAVGSACIGGGQGIAVQLEAV